MSLLLYSLYNKCDMKKIDLLAAGFAFIPTVVMAQLLHPIVKKDTLKNNKSAFIANSKLVTFSQLNQRKIYHWETGQSATPTGRQAGENTSGYVRVFGDSAVVVTDPFKKKY